MMYWAGFNMPGYLPDCEPCDFDDSASGMEYIKSMALEEVQATADDSELEALTEQVNSWKADENGEFGCTFRNYHYWVSKP